MPTEQEFLDQLFGGTRKPRQLGEPLRRAKLPSLSDDEDDEIDFVSDAERFRSEFGLNFSSTFRNAERNAQVGGKSNSYHLRGEAADIPTAGMSPETRDKTKSYWASLGNYDVIDEGNHIHVEPRPGIKSKTAFGQDGSGGTGKPAQTKQDEFLDQLFNPQAKPDFSNVRGSDGKTKAQREQKPKPSPEKSFLDESIDAISDVMERGYRRVMRGVTESRMDAVGVLPDNRKALGRVKRTPEELDFVVNEELNRAYPNASAEVREVMGRDLRKRFEYTQPMGSESDLQELNKQKRKEAERESARLAVAESKSKGKGFWEGVWNYIDNPVYGVLNRSWPANIIKDFSRAPEHELEDYKKVREAVKTQEIVDNPQNYSAEVVKLAQESIELREHKRAQQNPSIKQQWTDLRRAAKEHPERFTADFANALIADPEMLIAPVGIGVKPLQGISAAGRAARIADSIIDAGSTAAAMNLGMAASEKGAAGEKLSAAEARSSALTGFVVGGALGPLFSKGAAARERIGKGGLTGDDLENAMRDTAREELAVETVIERPETLPTAVRDTIEESLGIKNMTEAERKRWHRKRQAELKKTFEEQSLDADYYQFKADERVSRRTQLAEEAEARQAAEAAEAAKQQEVDLAYKENDAARTARFQEDYDRAIASRDNAAMGDEHVAAIAEDNLRNYTTKLDEQEIIDAAMHEDVPQIRRAMKNAAQRDAKLRVPKWQRGEVDSNLVARLGVGSLFAGTAYALADKDYKPGAALAAGLAALLLPGAGGSAGSRRVLSRMSQAGVIDTDGIITGLFKGRDPAKQLEFDTPIIERAKQGDQKAFTELFNDNYADIVRFANRKLRGVSGKIGMNGEDIASEVFTKAFSKIGEYESRVPYNAYLKKLAGDEVVDTIRRITAEKRGADFAAESMYNKFDSSDKTPALAGEEDGGYRSAIRGDVESASAGFESPEFQTEFMDAANRLNNIVDKLPEKQQQAFKLANIDNLSLEEVAEAMKESYANVRQLVSRAESTITEQLEKGYGARKVVESTQPTGEFVKRGRGRPRKQAGEIDPKLLKLGAIAALGAGAGAYLNEQNKLLGAGIGAAIAGGLLSRGRKGSTVLGQIAEGADYTLGVTSTRIMNKSPALWRRAIEHERVTLRDTHAAMTKVDPFLVRLQKLPEETKGILSRAILTGKPGVTDKILSAIGDKELTESWKQVRSTLDSLGDQLVTLRRFKGRELDYFPRIVKDVDGLLKALGNERGSFLEEALKSAEAAAIRNRGTGLSDIEKSLIINKVLKEEKHASQQPGFAKDRVVEEITPELQQYYASPTESLHSYIRSAVEDIQRAKFFGEDLKVVSKSGKEYTNVDDSIGSMVNRLMNEGKLTAKDAEEVAGLLKSRFVNGERAPAEIIQAAKNLSYAGLLGNPFSAAVQFGDAILQAYTQDISSALNATVRSVTGRKILNMKDFGLSDHIAEEFASTAKTAKALNKIFKYSLFKGVDEFGKDVALNAAILRFGKLAKTDKGVNEIARRYGSALQPDEMSQLIKDLQKGEATDLVRSIAFAELSRTQPITRLELPQAYLDNPNGRVLYQFKTFMIKQIDLARRDVYNEMKAGNIKKGAKNMAELGVVLGMAGASTGMIKDFMLGKDVDFKASDIPLNMLKTFGLSQYFMDQAFGVSKEDAKNRREDGDEYARAQKAKPLAALVGTFTPPAKMFDEIISGDAKAIRYIPFVGPYLYEQQQQKKKEESKK